MSDRIEVDTLTDSRDVAAYWYERFRSGNMTPQEKQDFDAWLARDPQHQTHYQRIQALWAVTEQLPQACAAQSQKASTSRQSKPLRSRRAFLGYGLAMAGAAGVAAVTVGPWQWGAAITFQQVYTTAQGEQRNVMLPDGSSMMLNTDTVAEVRFSQNKRLINLQKGEALFAVQTVANSPFIVQMDMGSVQVTGTQFNIYQADQGFTVTVLEGSVQVETGPRWHPVRQALAAGKALRVTEGVLAAVPADAHKAVAWSEGKVVFRGTSLRDAIQELKRYNDLSVQLTTAQLGQLKVSGVFRLDDPYAFLEALPHIIPVGVKENAQNRAFEIFPLQQFYN
ncbi:FecR family protein [Paenalcaligenes sp. Me131]|uniref:FecR family protein n=1 Tax=Paenalcaligenes sp. Me131 TaxID=3392636 RepID=UPI003D295FE6